MNSRKLLSLLAAGFIGVTLIGASTQALASPVDVVVKAKPADPATQRSVRYGDLNLAFPPDQKILGRRISRTASDICFDLNGFFQLQSCTSDAVASTVEQVEAAITRAKLKMAGKPTGPAIAITMVVGGR